MKNVIIILVVLALIGGTAFVLSKNKAVIEESKKIPALKAVAVTVAAVDEKTFSDNLAVLGTVIANREINVMAETQGKVLDVLFENGQTVSKGQTLVRVDGELRNVNVMSAQVNFDKAQADVNRFEAAFKDKAITESQVEAARFALKAAEAQLLAAKRQLRDTNIVAPFSGIINSKNVEVGTMLVTVPPTSIASLIDISTLKVKVSLAEKEVFKVKRGDKVDITTDVYGSTVFKGVVDVIGVKGDDAHNYPIEIVLQNNGEKPLKAGMFCKASFSNLPSRNMVSIPREALVGSSKNPQVYVVEGNKAKLKSLVLGAEIGTYIEVLGGLQKGEQVVVNGQINLNDGMEVKVL
jgi:RND family efflux transporter MFP subunit